jgi:four helix bundle protein
LDIAQGSCFELETQIILSFDLNYISEVVVRDLWKRIDEYKK